MTTKVTVSRPVASPLAESEITFTGTVTEMPNNGGWTLDVIASGTGLNAPPFTISADTVNGSDTIAGTFGAVKVGDAIAGTGIPTNTTVAEVNTDNIKLSKAVTADGTGVSLTFTPPANGIKVASFPISMSPAQTPDAGTALEFSVKFVNSVGEKVLGTVASVLDTELSANRVPRK
jgi:hypothetical protein